MLDQGNGPYYGRIWLVKVRKSIAVVLRLEP